MTTGTVSLIRLSPILSWRRVGCVSYDTQTPVLFVDHGVRRNGEDYRDYWLDLG
jgi:hypothetical protein